MTNRILKIVGLGLLVSGLAVSAQFWTAAHAQTGAEPSLVGSWDVQVTIRDCASGAPLFGFPATITYNQGGTMQESDLGSPGITRLEGHGVWSRQSASRQFAAAYRWLNFNPDRSYAGTNVVRSAVTLSLRGNEYTSTDTGELVAPDGTVIPLGCATTTASRFQ